MTEFNLDKYQTCLELYNEPSIEDEENYEPFLFYIKSKKFCIILIGATIWRISLKVRCDIIRT